MYESLKIDVVNSCENIVNFIKQGNDYAKTNGLLIGLSGGVDSSLCAVLAKEALGGGNILGVIIPSKDSNPDDKKDAISFANWLKIKYKVFPITPILEMFNVYDFVEKFDKEAVSIILHKSKNTSRHFFVPDIMKLRSRMLVLTKYSYEFNYLQCQTINKTEKLLGLGDTFGDFAGDIAPIYNLYKTQVSQLAKYLKIPYYILNKAPTSGLHSNLSDEKELGMTSDKVDFILQYFSRLEYNYIKLENSTLKMLANKVYVDTEKVKRLYNEFLNARSEINFPMSLVN